MCTLESVIITVSKWVVILYKKAYFFLTAITHNRGTCHNLESIYDIDMREILLKFVVTPRNDILLIHTHAIVKTRSCVVLSRLWNNRNIRKISFVIPFGLSGCSAFNSHTPIKNWFRKLHTLQYSLC